MYLKSLETISIIYIGIFINTVPADGLAPVGARPSAGMVLTSSSPIYIQYQHL